MVGNYSSLPITAVSRVLPQTSIILVKVLVVPSIKKTYFPYLNSQEIITATLCFTCGVFLLRNRRRIRLYLKEVCSMAYTLSTLEVVPMQLHLQQIK